MLVFSSLLSPPSLSAENTNVRRTPVLLNDSITVESVSSSSIPEQSQVPQDGGAAGGGELEKRERSAGDQEGDDIVTFEEFKAKMGVGENVPTNQPQKGERRECTVIFYAPGFSGSNDLKEKTVSAPCPMFEN